jgi:hypothetical protein
MPAQAKTGPLNAAEQGQLAQLLTRAGQAEMSALRGSGRAPAKQGKKYQALANLSVPQANGERTDLVTPGNTVTLTDEEAAHFLGTCGDAEHAFRRQQPMVRLASEGSEPLPKLTGRELSGPIRRPPPPAPGSDAARPDPPGSSHIAVYRDPGLPELNEPVPGSESGLGPDALDIAPGGGVNVEGGLTAASRR